MSFFLLTELRIDISLDKSSVPIGFKVYSGERRIKRTVMS